MGSEMCIRDSLRNAHVIDPEQEINEVMDIAFSKGKIAALENGIVGSKDILTKNLRGLIVTPGLIDMHTHVYWGGTSIGIDADLYSNSSAISTLVDTGSVGPGNFSGFKKHVIEKSRARILIYLHVSHAGIFAFSNRIMVGESEEMRLMDPETAIEIANANKDIIVGIKVRIGKWTSGLNGISPLEVALKVGEACQLPVCLLYTSPSPRDS